MMKRILLSLTCVLFLSLSPSAQAYYYTPQEQCTNVDLRSNFPLKMRNQGTISWCYAHAAADYLQYMHKIPEQISAADIAIGYYQGAVPKIVHFFQGLFNREIRQAPSQGGIMPIAMDRARKAGFCPESAFPSETWKKRDLKTGAVTEVPLLDAIPQLAKLQAEVWNHDLSESELPWTFEFKNISKSKFYSLLWNSKSKKLLNNLRIAACSADRRPFPYAELSSHFNLRGKSMFPRINESLDSATPLTIDFYYGVLENTEDFPRPLLDLHTTLLAGRRYDENAEECSYMIKNSYGPSCASYDPSLKCEDGYIWIPESILFDATLSYFILRDEQF